MAKRFFSKWNRLESEPESELASELQLELESESELESNETIWNKKYIYVYRTVFIKT